MQSDLAIYLEDGTYRLSAPLVFGSADSGMNGHTVTWQAAPNAHAILSGGQPVTGWSLHDATKNIWQAAVGTGFDTRQLYVDGVIATRAQTAVNRSDLTFTADGFAFTAAEGFLNGLVETSRIEIEAIGSWTDRYSPVQAIGSGTVTMVQPAWGNNLWGYDTIPQPAVDTGFYAENAYEFLDAPGEWYLDTTTGTLYYAPLSGQDMSQVDVEIPHLGVLLEVAGTYDQPAHDLVFDGIQFSHTTWLGPGSTDGFADQYMGTFISGGGYPAFEATRPVWHEVPGAVQISAASNVSILNGKFVDLGQTALGVGNDANAHASGVGLGADGITITGNLFAQDSGGGIVVGGVQADAHHPSDPRMTNQNIVIKDNLIHDVAIDYRDMVSILVTYTTNATIAHNEVYNLPYNGIALGYGWGTNDAGGSQDYVNRGLYNYQPTYMTPTTAKNNQVLDNFVHDAMLHGIDGGCIYFESANPGTVVSGNHCLNLKAGLASLYNDEGSRYLTFSNNVLDSPQQWSFANAYSTNNTGNLTLTDNWTSVSQGLTSGSEPNGLPIVVSGTVVATNGAWPTGAQQVVSSAGLEPAYASLKSQ